MDGKQMERKTIRHTDRDLQTSREKCKYEDIHTKRQKDRYIDKRTNK